VYGRLRPDVDARAHDLYRTQLSSHMEVMFLAEQRGIVAGILRCVDSASSPLLFPARYCYVSSVYVRPAHRRGGVLRALMAAAEAWCRERELGEMRLHNSIASSMAGPAWDALGFEVVEEMRRRPVDARHRLAARAMRAETR
jgi:GNAT superfamily N-acetyltransferase